MGTFKRQISMQKVSQNFWCERGGTSLSSLGWGK